jgi:galactosamine-6-phosphate isomerase
MEIIIEPTYEELGARAATDLLRIVRSVPAPLLCPTSGSTPAALYKALVQQIQQEKIDYSRWHFVGLDEWAGMNGTDAGSCRDFVNTELFHPLGITSEQICFFDGRAPDLQHECTRVETFIQQHGGITAAIIGLGLNGHVGMNEPGTQASQRAYVATIAEETQNIGQKYFSEPKVLSHGLTLGIATLLEAQHLFLMANGEKKAAIIKRIIEEGESEVLPATLLKKHPNFTIYLDKEAARLIS